MEQTVNSFQKGMQMDTSPMMQGTDSYTNALNATIITMNGEEVILQNDMGNRRVDNAYLPAGYIPVGMKEYGGIIYVASYNPINGRSLIGSFPSPERKFSSPNSGLDAEADIDNAINYIILQEDIVLDTAIVQISKNNLHPGDKFVVSGDAKLTSSNKIISNCDNITGDKVTSPKNKCYTLALGVLNSLNQFVDITSSLVRWKNNTIMSLDDKSDLIKFNSGYFIPSEYTKQSENNETINDAELKAERLYLTLTANTYSYKLVGPLYLQVKLNHIQEFNYNIYGTATRNEGTITGADIYIEGFLTYNCPDGFTGGEGDSNYFSYEDETTGSFDFFKLKGTTGGTLKSSVTLYNPETNLYSAKVVKHYNITNQTSLSDTIKVYANTDLKSNFIKGLETEIEIDFNKLGSGIVEIKGYRFYSDVVNRLSLITLILDAYPKYGESFKDLTLNFYKYKKETSIPSETSSGEIIIQNVFNGKTTITVDWDLIGIEEGDLYEIEFTYKTESSNNIEPSNNGTSSTNQNTQSPNLKRWFLATTLMNKCYTKSEGMFIADYGKPEEESKEEEILEKLFIINTHTILNYKNYSKDIKYANVSSKDNWILTENKLSLEIEFLHEYDINIKTSPIIEINNGNLYPNIIELSQPEKFNYSIETDENLSQIVFNTETIDQFNNTNNEGLQASDFVQISESISGNSDTNNITGKIIFKDLFKGNTTNEKIIKNPFADVYYCDENGYNSSKDIFGIINSFNMEVFGGPVLDEYVRRDEHILNQWFFNNVVRANWITTHGDVSETTADGVVKKGFRITQRENDSGNETFSYYENKGEISTNFNKQIDSPFVFVFDTNVKGSEWYSCMSASPICKIYDVGHNKYARVWWRCTQSEDWAMFDLCLEDNKNCTTWNDIKNEFAKFLYEKIFRSQPSIYCFTDEAKASDLGIYVPSDKCNYNYEYTITGNLKVKVVEESLNLLEELLEIILSETNNKMSFKKEVSTEDIIEIPITLKSSEEFLNLILKFVNSDTINNIWIRTGLDKDSDNNDLNSKYIYSYNNLTFKIKRSPLKNILVQDSYGKQLPVDLNNSSINMKTILYSGYNIGTPSLRYDHLPTSNTSLYYDKVNIVNTM